MKDTVRRLIATILGLAGISVLGYYMYNNVTIVQDTLMQHNFYVLGGIGLLCLLFILRYAVGIMPIKWLKIRAVVVGLLLVLAGHYFLINNPNAGIFAGDMIALLGVVIVFLTLGGLIVTTKAAKKIEQSKQIVIEV